MKRFVLYLNISIKVFVNFLYLQVDIVNQEHLVWQLNVKIYGNYTINLSSLFSFVAENFLLGIVLVQESFIWMSFGDREVKIDNGTVM